MGKRALVSLAGTCMVGLALIGCRPDNNVTNGGKVSPSIPGNGNRNGPPASQAKNTNPLGQLPPVNPGGTLPTGGTNLKNDIAQMPYYESPVVDENVPGGIGKVPARDSSARQPIIQEKQAPVPGGVQHLDSSTFRTTTSTNRTGIRVDDGPHLDPTPSLPGKLNSGATPSFPDLLPPTTPLRSLGKTNASESPSIPGDPTPVPPVPSPTESKYGDYATVPPLPSTFKQQPPPPDDAVPTMPLNRQPE